MTQGASSSAPSVKAARSRIEEATLDDEQCLAALRQGGSAAERGVRALYRRYGTACRERLARGLGVTWQETEDFVQEAFARLWQSLATLRGASLGAWLCQTARRVAIDQWRRGEKDHKTQPLEPEVEQAWVDRESGLLGRQPEDPARAVLREERRARVGRAFRDYCRRHPNCCRSLRWILVEGGSHRELAARLGRTEAATRELVSQCRKKWRAELLRQGADLLDEDL
jgi:RNA polymerase sigma factor (sigma-70 family)